MCVSVQDQQRQALPTATAGIYYVSTTGNDSNSGSSSAPFKTIQRCANIVTAGNTCNVLVGSYSERVYATNSGRSGSPITFQAQGKAIVKGFVIRADYIIVKDFEIANTDKDNAGVHIKGAYNIIENNYIHHAASHAVEFYDYPIDNSVLISHDNVVRNNRLYYNNGSAIVVNGRNNLIENNEIWGSQQCLPSNGGGCIDPDGMNFFGQGHIFRGNYIHDISYGAPGINPSVGDYVNDAHIDCFQTFASSYGERASNILFEGNYCDNLQFQNDYEKGQGWMIEGNVNNITIKNNLVRAYRGINTNGGDGTLINNLYVYNNTFVNNLAFPAQPNVAELFNAPHSIIKNNIFYDQKHSIFEISGDTTGLVIDYNLIYNSDGSSPARLTYPGSYPFQHTFYTNPKFVNSSTKDYHLQAGSPACTGGENGTYMGAYDCERPVGPTATTVPSSTPTVYLSPTNTATRTPTLTRTPTRTPTITKTPTITPTAVVQPTRPSATVTSTITKTVTSSPVPTNTSTKTSTPTKTNTPVPPTVTGTITPTKVLQPTRVTQVPTNTSIPTQTATNVPPTSTAVATITSRPTNTPFVPTPIPTPIPVCNNKCDFNHDCKITWFEYWLCRWVH